MEETLRQTDSDCMKIVLFGPESTGKTTLAKQLAAHFDTEWVQEYMRTYLQKKWDDQGLVCTKEDMLPIAQGQIHLENKAAKKANRLLFCDTNLLELKTYSEYYFDGFCSSEISEAIKNQTYHHYFLTYIDTPWEADDLRDRPNDRLELFRIFEQQLIDSKLPYTVLKGGKEERFETAVTQLDKHYLATNVNR